MVSAAVLEEVIFKGMTKSVPLTLSAGVINDAADSTNLLHVQGGTWQGPAVTDLLANINAAVDVTGLTDHSSTTTRVTSGVTAFGGTAFQVVSGNAAANEGPSQAITGGASATAYTVSVWAWLISGAATVRSVLSDSVAGKQGSTGVVLTTTPQKITVSATTGAAAGTFAAYVETTVQQAGTWRFGGWQVGTGSVGNPVALSGSRAAGQVQVPWDAGMFTTAQGWVAARLAPAYANNTSPETESFTFSLGDDGTHRLHLEYIQSSQKVGMFRVSGGGTGQTASTAALTFAANTAQTWAGYWTPTLLGASANGAAFVTQAQSSIPTLVSRAFDIGRLNYSATGYAWANFLWLACGSGVLTDADAVLLNNFGNTKPTLRQLPGHATLIWDGRTGTAQRRAAA